MKRVVIGLIAVIVVAVLAVAALPFVVSADFVARQITEVVRDQTGRELALGEEPHLSFYPDFAIELRDVALSNPPGMPAGDVMLTDNLRVKVALWPLLSGKLQIKAFVVETPRLNLLIDGEGHSNWVFDSRQPTPAETSRDAAASDEEPLDIIDAPADPAAYPSTAMRAVELAPVEIQNGTVRYLDERNGVTFMAEDVNLTLSLADLDSPFSARGSLIWNGQRVNLDAVLRHPAQLAAGSASAAEVTLASPLLNAGYDGQISLKDGLSLAGVVGFSTPSLRELMQWAGQPLPDGQGLGPFRAESAIGLQHKTLTLKDADIALDGMKARGNVRLELDGARPKVIATLGVDTVDLNVYRGDGEPTAKGGASSEPSALVDGWSMEPIDLSGLKAIDADLTLNAGRVIFGNVKTDAGGLRLLIDNGLLEAQLSNLALYGGTAAGNVQLDGSKAVPTLRLALSASDFASYELLRDLTGLKQFEGRGAASVSLAGTGRSQAELVSTLRGNLVFRVTDGALRGVDLGKMVNAVAAHVVDGWMGGQEALTDFSLFEGSFQVENGVAANDDLTLLGPLVRVSGEGSVDLARQTLDYRVDPQLVAKLQPKNGEQALEGFSVPIVVKGPWSRPKIYPDIEGVMKDPQAAYKQFKGLVQATRGLDLGSGGKAIDGVLDNVGPLLNQEIGKSLGPDTTSSFTGSGAGQFLDGLMKGGLGARKPQPSQGAVEPRSAGEQADQPEPGAQPAAQGGESLPAPVHAPQNAATEEDSTDEPAGEAPVPAEAKAPEEEVPHAPAPEQPSPQMATPDQPVPQTSGKGDAL
ncbi:AsmA family protein [Rhodoligotrophos defluvii]|uniref:AsmA family protein n=1 Tax=Rhodoligotrophos defluvii TaxID=2561934 RepID=UPI00148506F0|nr:AsmA family protein [Rhodoligotrophos defluvii]